MAEGNEAAGLAAATWKNWSENRRYDPASDDGHICLPRTRAELIAVLDYANSQPNCVVRVSGQRHSQPPLVADPGAPSLQQLQIDLSCYTDLGPAQDQRMIADTTAKTVRVNAGVREDELCAFLTENKLMLKTVTAGGFFSIGGITAVDVNGATLDQPIIAGNARAFTLLRADGQEVTIDASTPQFEAEGTFWDPINFARVNLGALGVVASVELDVMERPYAETLVAGRTELSDLDRSGFVEAVTDLATHHDRLEIFFNPYGKGAYTALHWDIQDPTSKTPPVWDKKLETACQLAKEEKWGSSVIGMAPMAGRVAQRNSWLARALSWSSVNVIRAEFAEAQSANSDLWLWTAARTIFMSYFVEIGAVDDQGVGLVYDALQEAVALNNSPDESSQKPDRRHGPLPQKRQDLTP